MIKLLLSIPYISHLVSVVTKISSHDHTTTYEATHKKSDDETEKKVESDKEAVSVQKQYKENSSAASAARLIVLAF